MSCSVCQHSKRQDIDQALVAESATLAALSQEYGLSISALHRHKAHLQAKVNRTREKLQDNLRQGCFFWLSRALEMAMQTAEAARAEGNSKVVLQAILQGTRIIGIILKQDFQLDQEVVYQILASPQWVAQASLLPQDPQVLAASRQALTRALSSPCPDTAAAPPSPAPLGDLDLDALQAIFPTLVQSPDTQAKTGNQKPENENRPFKQREKSGKLPGKTPLAKENIKEDQKDMLPENNSGKDANSTCSWHEELAAGRLDIETLHAIGAGRSLPITEQLGKGF